MRSAVMTPKPGEGREQSGEPDPAEFALENFQAARGEEAAREEGDAQAAVGHGVEKTVADGGEREVSPE